MKRIPLRAVSYLIFILVVGLGSVVYAETNEKYEVDALVGEVKATMDELDALLETIRDISKHHSSLVIQEELEISLTDMELEEIIAENNALKSEIESIRLGAYRERTSDWSKTLQAIQDELTESEYMILEMAINSPSWSIALLHSAATWSGIIYEADELPYEENLLYKGIRGTHIGMFEDRNEVIRILLSLGF